MKLTPARLLAVKNTIFSLFGLSTMRFWAVVVMALDRATGFSPGRGFPTEYTYYLHTYPLKPIQTFLYLNIAVSLLYLAWSIYKEKKSAKS